MTQLHDFEELFEENPHPESMIKMVNSTEVDYLTINFEPGYDPENFSPEDIIALTMSDIPEWGIPNSTLGLGPDNNLCLWTSCSRMLMQELTAALFYVMMDE